MSNFKVQKTFSDGSIFQLSSGKTEKNEPWIYVEMTPSPHKYGTITIASQWLLVGQEEISWLQNTLSSAMNSITGKTTNRTLTLVK